MASSILERARSYHEDTELLEKAVTEIMVQDTKTHRDSLIQQHFVNMFLEKIEDRHQKLAGIYKDEDGSKAEELKNIMGVADPMVTFKARIREINDFHMKYPGSVPERSEAQDLLAGYKKADKPPVDFTGEEGVGRYVDMHALFNKFINLKGVNPNNRDYMEYLTSFHKFDPAAVRDQNYKNYLQELYDYLVSFFRRSQPLFMLDTTVAKFTEEFSSAWKNKSYTPIGIDSINAQSEGDAMDVDGQAETQQPARSFVLPWELNYNDGKFHCSVCNKTFSKDTVFKSHLGSPKHKTAETKYEQTIESISKLEFLINRLGDLLADAIVATKENIQKKQARRHDEDIMDDEDELEMPDLDEEIEEVRLTKKFYPVGWDGNPIPFWLYKLHGLGIEYKCEICGNTSYWGRRAFEKHFSDWRHAHGMKCLGLENTKEFFEVTKIQDALDLAKKLKVLRSEGKWKPTEMEEYEDSEGNVMDRKTYEMFAKQLGGYM